MANLFLTGSGVPTNAVGEVTDYYRDTATNLIYYRAALGWEVVPSLIPTPDGVGTNWLFGTGAPNSGVGSTNDYYRDDANGSVYRKHAVNGWEAKGSLDFIGVYGVQWGEGTGAPANIPPLNNLPAGSFYLDVATSDIYYKDNTLTWSNKGQFGNAKADVILAQAAQAAAEAARDAALIQAGVYATEAAGRAAVADGVAFKVQGSGDIAAYEYRRVDALSSTLIAAYPSSSALSFVERSTEAVYVNGQQVMYSVVDSAGRALAYIGMDGVVYGKLPVAASSGIALTRIADGSYTLKLDAAVIDPSYGAVDYLASVKLHIITKTK